MSPLSPHPAHTPARAAIALDPGHVVRPAARIDAAAPRPVAEREALLDAGRYPHRNPPAAPAVLAARDSADALFRARARGMRS